MSDVDTSEGRRLLATLGEPPPWEMSPASTPGYVDVHTAECHENPVGIYVLTDVHETTAGAIVHAVNTLAALLDTADRSEARRSGRETMRGLYDEMKAERDALQAEVSALTQASMDEACRTSGLIEGLEQDAKIMQAEVERLKAALKPSVVSSVCGGCGGGNARCMRCC